jgi:transposase-like protein/DNA-binding transcriptional regulator YiaG
MGIKGEKPPRRTPEQQKAFDEVLPLLIAGRTPIKELSDKYGIAEGTLRAWRSRHTSRTTPKPLPYTPTHDIQTAVTAAVKETLAQVQQDIATQEVVVAPPQATIATLQQAVIDNALAIQQAVVTGRGEVEGGLSSLAKALKKAIQRIESIIESGVTVKTATYEGDTIQTETKLTILDIKQASETLKVLQDQLASLYNLPLGAVKPASFKLDPPRNTQHAHVHLHNKSYGQDVTPLKGNPPAIEAVAEIKATPAGETAMQEWQRRLMEDD